MCFDADEIEGVLSLLRQARIERGKHAIVAMKEYDPSLGGIYRPEFVGENPSCEFTYLSGEFYPGGTTAGDGEGEPLRAFFSSG